MQKDSLYLALKNRLCEMIYKGIYKDGENIPPERVLAETLNVSRVTVRKALELLEKDGIVERVQGSGTQIRLRQTGYKGTMDIIALLAPAQKPFFAAFIDYFQQNADKNGSLVLFMQNPRYEKVEDSLFKLFQKNIRNVVVWLEDLKLDSEYIRRLRGLGMNIVFFDISVPSPYADCVLLDNKDAVRSLYKFLGEKGVQSISYVGWDNLSLTSVKERQMAFNELSTKKDSLFQVPWKEKACLAAYMDKFVSELKNEESLSDGIICADGELGVSLKKAFLAHHIENTLVVSIDDFKEAEELSLSVYSQSFQELAEKVYTCILHQNKHPRKWKASIYAVKGKLIGR
ncbi:MAG: hypothetical protein K0S71_2152 [Clostridia bacterium]|nr:hypothetical protein [Clostridia bacterium]